MQESERKIHIRKINPACNMRRFYALSIERDLFGNYLLVRRWGRIGTKGRMRVETFRAMENAEQRFETWKAAKLARGYSPPESADR